MTTAARTIIPLEPIAGDGLTRRQAMQLMAASLALASGACTRTPEHRLVPYVNMPEAGRGDLPAYYASAVVRDGHALGVLIGTRDGRPIKIEGNPQHPSSLGATDVFAQATILELWDPDRSQTVRQRLPSADKAVAELPRAPSTWAAFEAAWRERATMLAARRGEGLAVLTDRFASPTLAAQLQAVMQRYPAARWYRHAPSLPASARRAAKQAFGRECDWVFHLDRARFVLALAADPFSDGPGHVRAARDWASGRTSTASSRRGEVARSVAIETAPSLFGARADERLALPPAAIESLVDELAAAITGADGDPTSAPPLSTLAGRLAAELRAAGDAALIIAGPTLSAQAHAAVASINQRLGAIGHTLDAIDPLDAVPGVAPASLGELVEAIGAGTVDTLIVVGGNPVYEAPGSLAVAATFARVPFSAHLSLHDDETSARTVWHLPASHEIESWADARGHDGTVTIVQPAILPLYDSRSPIELLALIGGGEGRDGHALVQSTWRDADWHGALRLGLVEGSAARPIELPPAAVPKQAAGAKMAALVAVFTPDPSVGHGRFANNAWLQELPRPFSKITWGNALQLGPRTAARLKVATGDVVRASAGVRSIEAPVHVLDGHAEDAATLPLGYGRRAAGSVGNGVGFDAYRLSSQDGTPVAIEITPTGQRHRFAVTQHRLDQLGRDLAKTVVAGEGLPHAKPKPSLYPPIAYPEHAWAMVIDLDACIGCNACTIACQAENNIPVVGAEQVIAGREMHWIRVDTYPDDKPGNRQDGERDADTAKGGAIFQPVPCMHCEDAPCEVVCPVGATVHDSEGLNVQVYNRCVGTRFCSNNCPYKVRRFNFLQYADETTETLKAMRNPDVTVRQVGVMEKCTYCLQRLSRARLHAEKAGVPIADGDVLTACQSVCPTAAIHFGDRNDPASDVVRAKASPRHYAMLDELNTRPRTTYLARVVQPKKATPS